MASSTHSASHRYVAAACVALGALFFFFPQLDLWASGLFYTDGQWSPLRDSAWVRLPYDYVPLGGRLLLLGALVLWALGPLPALRPHIAPGLRRQCAFLLVAAALGQGLFIDTLLKNQMGRARPAEVEAFGGERQFTPAFVPSDQCQRNCSFVSGHVGATAFLMGLGWLAAPARRRRWLMISIAAAGYMGACRVIQGGHFLSDAVLAWFFTYGSFWLTERLFRHLRWLP